MKPILSVACLLLAISLQPVAVMAQSLTTGAFAGDVLQSNGSAPLPFDFFYMEHGKWVVKYNGSILEGPITGVANTNSGAFFMVLIDDCELNFNITESLDATIRGNGECDREHGTVHLHPADATDLESHGIVLPTQSSSKPSEPYFGQMQLQARSESYASGRFGFLFNPHDPRIFQWLAGSDNDNLAKALWGFHATSPMIGTSTTATYPKPGSITFTIAGERGCTWSVNARYDSNGMSGDMSGQGGSCDGDTGTFKLDTKSGLAAQKLAATRAHDSLIQNINAQSKVIAAAEKRADQDAKAHNNYERVTPSEQVVLSRCATLVRGDDVEDASIESLTPCVQAARVLLKAGQTSGIIVGYKSWAEDNDLSAATFLAAALVDFKEHAVPEGSLFLANGKATIDDNANFYGNAELSQDKAPGYESELRGGISRILELRKLEARARALRDTL